MLKTIKKIIIFCFIIAICFIAVNFAFAQDLNVGLEYGDATELGTEDPRVIAANIIRVILGFLGILAVGLIIYAGWLYMTGGGNSEKIEKAKKILIGAIIGLIIILSAFAIASFILSKVLDITGGGGGGGCTEGDIKACGCGGIKTCVSGSWGLCVGSDCGGGPGLVYCDGNSLTPVCEADNSICEIALGSNYYCATSTCECVLAGGYGDSCDADVSTPSCEASNDLCQTYLECRENEDCLCLGAPVIEWISPVDENNTPNGTYGNFITIGGRYFGTTTNEVYFWDGSGFNVKAYFPNIVNPNCNNNWRDDQIIVIVPEGAVDGPIKVIRFDDEEDTTDNDRGPLINDFDINDIARPGLCLASPDNGFFDDLFGLEGISFSGGSQNVAFGSASNNISANNIANWSDTHVEATVPNIKSGRNTIFVNIDDIDSNNLSFTVFYDYASDPVIDYIDPAQGPVGQYITIYGNNFGVYKSDTSKIQFYLPADPENLIYGDISFPDACQGKWWHNNYIVVKVPLVDVNDYNIIVTNNENKVSAPVNFSVINSEPGPGLCLLDPHNGNVGYSIDSYGDNFKNNQDLGRAIFYSNIDGIVTSWANQQISVNVPIESKTGPFKVVNNSGYISNSLPFTVGLCDLNEECQLGEECCGSETYWNGICRQEGSCGEGNFSSCAFGWTFSTRSLAPDTCSGFTSAYACADAGMCPNSPGQCQTNSNAILGECGDNYCNNNYSDCFNNCVYDNDLNKCKLVNISCDVENSLLISGYTAECREVDGVGFWQINTGGTSCMLGTFMDNNEWCTVGTISNPALCDLCDTGFECDGGFCAIDSSICPKDSVCQNDECILDNSTCECCCRTGYSAQDCCAGLTCEPGNCGAGAPEWGLCTGCRVELDGNYDSVTEEEQEISNESCDCFGKGNRYCHIIPGDPLYSKGVCEDRAFIGEDCYDALTAATCNPSNPICVDGTFCDPDSNCTCQELAGPGEDCYDALTAATCNPSNPICVSNYFCDSDSNCTCQLLGELPGTSCYDDTLLACSLNCTIGYGCIGDSGCSGISCSSDETSCLCCCNLIDDHCGDINTGDPSTSLACQIDKEPCLGDNRGLCCGCNEDINCGDVNGIGCGLDACCRQRPVVEDVYPVDNAENVCNNILISANFSDKMNINSFVGKVVVVGDYVNDVCPENTSYLSLNGKKFENKNFLAKVYYNTINKLKKILRPILVAFGEKVLAGSPDPSHNYCAISGSVNGYHKADGTTTLNFSPSNILDSSRTYYVIIKGDEDLNSNKGVLSYWNVGMNGPDTEFFNNIEFRNAKIWSFTTISDQASTNGLCEISRVEIDPDYYLFQTNENDLIENDLNFNDKTFDTVKDSDKVFLAKAMSIDGQSLSSVPGYAWEWSWSIDNLSIANIVDVLDMDNYKKLIRAGNNITDGKTKVNAIATITEDNLLPVSTIGQEKIGVSNIWIFLCENPWPPIRTDGTWFPWQDTGSNCTIIDGGCYNTNYELYYCRDSGGVGTSDDLPAILSADTITRGLSNTQNVLKESYFFRENLPDISNLNLAISSIPEEGNKIILNWNSILIPAEEELAGYKIYYGDISGKYDNYIEVGDINVKEINNLVNDKIYYFSVTAVYASGAESIYSNEVSASPTDLLEPSAPNINSIISVDGKIELGWSDTSGGDAVGFRIFYKAQDDCIGLVNFGSSIAVPYNVFATSTIAGLSIGINYCFGMTSYDQCGNSSSTTTASIIP